MKTTPIIVLLAAFAAMAVEPNYVRTTIYKVGKDGVTDKDMVSTTYSDGLGRQIQSKFKISNDSDRVSCSFYDDAGRPDSSTNVFIDHGANAGSYLPGDLGTLNAAGGPLRDQYPSDLNPFSYSKYSDDPLSRVIEQNGPGQDYTANPVKTWYFGVRRETYSVTIPGSTIQFTNGFITSEKTDDRLNLLSEHIEPNADHFLTVTKSPESKAGNQIYSQELKDLFGKTVATRATASQGGRDIISQFSYDILGNLTTETAPSGDGAVIDNSTYTYNTLGQLIKKVTPDGGIFGYNYTATGQIEHDTSYMIISEEKVVNRLRRYSYDALDRLVGIEEITANGYIYVQKNYYDDISEIQLISQTYNIQNWELSNVENVIGRLVASVAINQVNNITYYVTDLFSYDDEGRIKQKTKIVPGLPHQYITYAYDIHGKMLTETTECGSEQVIKEYQYDAEGRLKNVVQPNNGNQVLATYDYDELSRLKKKDLSISIGHQVDYSYNIRDWVTSIAPPDGNSYINKFAETISQYYPNGNIKQARYLYNHSASLDAEDNTLTYGYDNVNRLKQITQSAGTGYTAHYTYDVIGRITSKQEGLDTKPDYKYYTGTNRLRNTDGSDANKYLYDKQGNMIVDINKKMIMEYDWRDMPVMFRFYDLLPTFSAVDERGYFSGNARKFTETNGGTLVSQVVMLYDASGNRVMKMEGK